MGEKIDRNLTLMGLATMARKLEYTVGVLPHPNKAYAILCIDLPTGQVGWLVPLEHFLGLELLPTYPGEWDINPVEVNRARLREFINDGV